MLRVAHRKDRRTTAALVDAALKNGSKSGVAKRQTECTFGFLTIFCLASTSLVVRRSFRNNPLTVFPDY